MTEERTAWDTFLEGREGLWAGRKQIPTSTRRKICQQSVHNVLLALKIKWVA
jgi:hypothetical protein